MADVPNKYTFKAISPDALETIEFEIKIPDLSVLEKPPPHSVSKAMVRVSADAKDKIVGGLKKLDSLVQSDYGLAVRAGKKALRDDNREKALRHFDTALIFIPEAKEVLRYRGNLLQEMGKDKEAQVCFRKLADIKEREDDEKIKIFIICLLIAGLVALGFAAWKWLVPWIGSIDKKEIRTAVYVYFSLLGVWLAGGVGIVIYTAITHGLDDIYETIKRDFEAYFTWGAIGFIGVVLVAIVGAIVIAVVTAIIKLIEAIVSAIVTLFIIGAILVGIGAAMDKK